MENKIINKTYKILFSNLNDLNEDSAYFYTKVVSDSIKSHSDRRLIKIKNPSSNLYIIRKVRGKSHEGLDSNKVIIDYLSAKELGLKMGDDVFISKPSISNTYINYYLKHPVEEIRFAYKIFIIGIFLSILSSLIL